MNRSEAINFYVYVVMGALVALFLTAVAIASV
jgi:hypothetical protein